MRLAEVAQAPAHQGNKGNKGNGAAIRIHKGIKEGWIYQANGIQGNIYTTHDMHGVGRYHDNGKEHHNALNKISPAHSHKATSQGVENHYKGTYQHSRGIVHAKEGAEQLASTDKAGAGINNEENNDEDGRHNPQEIAMVIEAVLQEIRQSQGVVGKLRIPPQPLCHKMPICPGTQAQTHGNPGRAKACQIGCSRHAHHHPAAHVRGLGTHCRNPGSQLAVADYIIIHAVCFAIIINSNGHHQSKIDNEGQDYRDIIHCYASYIKKIVIIITPS